MENFSKLLTSIAALLGVIAWPIAIVSLAVIFKTELQITIVQMSHAIKKVNKAAFAGISFEMEKIAAEEAAKDGNESGKITVSQVEAATRINIRSQNVDPQTILNQIDNLALQYDTLRQTMPSGTERTRAMTGIVVKMRSLALSAESNLENYKNSTSPGLRLAAITIMQMRPDNVDLHWLSERFKIEKPFVFYHASLALDNAARVAGNATEKAAILSASESAMSTLKKFDGIADANTVEVLDSIIESLRK